MNSLSHVARQHHRPDAVAKSHDPFSAQSPEGRSTWPNGSLDPIKTPPASSYLTCAKLALTCAQALPMIAAIRFVARPAPGVRDDAIESAHNLPRQEDILARQEAVTLSQKNLENRPLMLTHVHAANNMQWLASGFQLVLGAGFFCMYQHAGVLRALCGLGLHNRIEELAGLSSGALTGALYATLGPNEMTRQLLELSLSDFLDLSVEKFITQGALCAGKAVERKILRESSRYGCTRLEDAPGAKLSIAVFDGFAGKTVWHTRGPLAQTVARSAALPVLFANDGYFDGGWVDHHGYTALRPGQRALCMRINTGIELDERAKLVGRPTPLFNISEDPEHKTLALNPVEKITGSTFLFDIDFRKKKLVSIITESEELFKWWLYQPQA